MEGVKAARDLGPDASEIVAHQHEFDSIVTEIGAAHLLVGLPLLVVGVLCPGHVYVPDYAGRVVVFPIVGSNRVGGSFTLTF